MSGDDLRECYEKELIRFADEIAGEKRRIDGKLADLAEGDADERKKWQAMRVVLCSGLFDREWYLQKYRDVDAHVTDPLEHYVLIGDQEGRTPNPVFLPNYYRAEYMGQMPDAVNALAHYSEEGERAGARPSPAFDPVFYARANGLQDFAVRPLFHFLRMGAAAGEGMQGVREWRSLRSLLEYQYEDPGEYLLAEAKRPLVAGFGVEEGFARFRKVAVRNDAAALHVRQLVRMKEQAQSGGVGSYFDISPEGQDFEVLLPRVVGDAGRPGPARGVTRAVFLARFDHVHVRAGSDIIDCGMLAIVDATQDEWREQLERGFYEDTAVFHNEGETLWLMTPADAVAALEVEEAFMLLGRYDAHFGHWLLEYMPKYIAARMEDMLPPMPVLIAADAEPAIRESFEMAFPGVDMIEVPAGVSVAVRRLWYSASAQNHRLSAEAPIPAGLYARFIRDMAARMHRALDAGPGPERVFLVRSQPFSRRHVNSAEIEDIARARGFHVVHPERLGFEEQVRLVRDARFILGQAGSAMLLAFFARAGAKLCMLAPQGSLEFRLHQTAIFQELGLEVVLYAGERDRIDTDCLWESNYRTDVAVFVPFFEEWLGDAAEPG